MVCRGRSRCCACRCDGAREDGLQRGRKGVLSEEERVGVVGVVGAVVVRIEKAEKQRDEVSMAVLGGCVEGGSKDGREGRRQQVWTGMEMEDVADVGPEGGPVGHRTVGSYTEAGGQVSLTNV